MQRGGIPIGRILAISDIHGCDRELAALLAKVHYDPAQDQLVLTGDYVDRGRDSCALVEEIMRLHEQYGVVVLKGNHDKMFCDALAGDDDKLDTHWLTNGGYYTLMSYCQSAGFFSAETGWDEYLRAKAFIRSHFGGHLEFLRTLPLYYETEEHIFVHAGINPELADWRQQTERDFLWIREPFYTQPVRNTGKTVVFGHTSADELHGTPDIWFSPLGDKIGIDGGCAYGYVLNCLEIGDFGYKKASVRLGEHLTAGTA